MDKVAFTTKSKALGNIAVIFIILFSLTALISTLSKTYTNISFTVWAAILYSLQFSIILIKTIVIDKSKLKNLGFVFDSLPTKIFIGFGIAIGQLLIYWSILVFGFGLKPGIIVMGRTEMGISSAFLRTLFYIFFVGIAEESIYRGYILNELNDSFRNKVVVVLVTSLLFSLSHLLNMQIVQLIETFVVSIIYCFLRFKFKDKSIVPLIIAHGIFDSLPIWLGIIFFW